MKNIVLFVLILISCVPSSRERVSDVDTTDSAYYEDFSEVSPFTIKVEIRDDMLSLNGKRRSVKEYLARFYSPDTYTNRSAADSIEAPHYIITEVKPIEDNFFVRERQCQKRSLLLASRGNFVDQEFYDILFLGEKEGEELTLVDKITIDGSQGQSSTIVSAHVKDLAVEKSCVVLQLTSYSEGGDINLHKDDWVEFYVADDPGFRSVLKLQTERTDIQDYEVTLDDQQESFSEIREIDFLETSSNGLYDIAAHYVNRQNGVIVEQRDEVYRFNGSEYFLAE